MLAYLLRRVLATVPVILGVALLLFTLFHVVGGDPVYQMVGKHANPKQIEELRREYGLDQPKPVQFVRYLKQIATFDYGRSYATRQEVSSMVLRGVGPSLSLAIPAFLISTTLALLLSLFVAHHRSTWIDQLVVIGCVLGMSVPVLAYILFGQYYLAYKWQWFPISGYESGFPGSLQYLGLPILIWVTVSLGYDVRFFRTALLEETSQDYVRTARAKGLGEKRIYTKHVLKNGMIPIITNVVIEIPLLVLGSFLLENFFAIPGLGSITIDAVHNSDFPVIKAMTTLYALLFIFGNLLTDILYTWVDPRVSLK